MTQSDCDERQPPGVTTVCKKYQNPINDTFSFDNILMSIMNIFQVITLEGWTSMMYIVREATATYAYDIFFILIVLFGAFFVLNLMIAVQFTHLGEAFDNEDRRQKLIAEKIKYKKRLQKENKIQDSSTEEEGEG
jgi:ABC-type transport system involved in cytochrome bd biosynthesis fused ATPase/permease subunit